MRVHAAAKAALEDPAQEAAAAGARKVRQPAELMKLLLQAMVSGLVRTPDDIRSFLGSTLYCAQLKRDPHFQGPPLLASEARHAIARLKGQRLAQWDGSEWRGSGLGKAISVSERAVASGARTLHELEEVEVTDLDRLRALVQGLRARLARREAERLERAAEAARLRLQEERRAAEKERLAAESERLRLEARARREQKRSVKLAEKERLARQAAVQAVSALRAAISLG